MGASARRGNPECRVQPVSRSTLVKPSRKNPPFFDFILLRFLTSFNPDRWLVTTHMFPSDDTNRLSFFGYAYVIDYEDCEKVGVLRNTHGHKEFISMKIQN